jgi:hypothetical protein
MEQQELALLWAIQRLAALQTGPQLESSLVGLTTSAERSQLERLPVLMMGLGELVKRDRGIMWAYAALKHSMVRGSHSAPHSSLYAGIAPSGSARRTARLQWQFLVDAALGPRCSFDWL